MRERDVQEFYAGELAPELGVARRGAAPRAADRSEEGWKKIRDFSTTPRQVKAHLDEYVIGQDEAKRALAVAVCDHYNFVSRCARDPSAAEAHRVKPNVLLLGPTGVGKTHLMRILSKLLGVPFATADATKFSATGYVGADVEEAVRRLLAAADGDVGLAEVGILYMDEVDKLAEPRGGGRPARAPPVRGTCSTLFSSSWRTRRSARRPPAGARARSARETPRLLLRQVPSTPTGSKPTPAGVPSLRTRHILFVFSGAFSALEDALRRRAAAAGVAPPQDALALADATDLVAHGLEPEFVGRVPVRAACGALREEDLYRVLAEAKDSVAAQMVRDFEGYGIRLRLRPCALREVARQAAAERTGARGLLTVLERSMREFKFELPSTDVRRLDVDARAIRRPVQVLAEILESRAGTS